MNSYKIVPAANAKTVSTEDTANSFGLHDTLRYGPRSLASEVVNQNDLQRRLDNWEETQDKLKLTMLRDTMGLHMPIRLLMERKIAARNPHMPILPVSNVHLDILMGRDESIEPFDVFDATPMATPINLHEQMERKLRL